MDTLSALSTKSEKPDFKNTSKNSEEESSMASPSTYWHDTIHLPPMQVKLKGSELELFPSRRTEEPPDITSKTSIKPKKILSFSDYQPNQIETEGKQDFPFISALEDHSIEYSWIDEQGKKRQISTLSLSSIKDSSQSLEYQPPSQPKGILSACFPSKQYCPHCCKYVGINVKYRAPTLPFWKQLICKICMEPNPSYIALHACRHCNLVLTKVNFNNINV